MLPFLPSLISQLHQPLTLVTSAVAPRSLFPISILGLSFQQFLQIQLASLLLLNYYLILGTLENCCKRLKPNMVQKKKQNLQFLYIAVSFFLSLVVTPASLWLFSLVLPFLCFTFGLASFPSLPRFCSISFNLGSHLFLGLVIFAQNS